LAENTFSRVRVDGVDRWVHVDSVEVATVRHRTSRAGDPHRHVHDQISSRVHAAGRWRAVDGGSALGGRGRAGWSTALNRISERVIYSDPEVLVALAGHGATNRSDRVLLLCRWSGWGSLKPSEFVGAGARPVKGRSPGWPIRSGRPSPPLRSPESQHR